MTLDALWDVWFDISVILIGQGIAEEILAMSSCKLYSKNFDSRWWTSEKGCSPVVSLGNENAI